MEISIAEFARARETVAMLLDPLRLHACTFDLEPRDGDWALTIECAIEEGWGEVSIRVGKDELTRARKDAAAREMLLAQWRERLAACKRGG
jgi:hypothetical protein